MNNNTIGIFEIINYQNWSQHSLECTFSNEADSTITISSTDIDQINDIFVMLYITNFEQAGNASWSQAYKVVETTSTYSLPTNVIRDQNMVTVKVFKKINETQFSNIGLLSCHISLEEDSSFHLNQIFNGE